MLPNILLYIIALLIGICVGRFLNLLIYKILKGENAVRVDGHCASCGCHMKWYESIPFLGYWISGCKCHECKTKYSIQPSLVEGLNGVLYLAVVVRYELSIDSLLYCLLFSALLALSVVDFKTYEIPVGFNYFILALGGLRVISNLSNWLEYAIGLLAVSAVLTILYYATQGAAIGGGDVKLMGTCGLLLGWKMIILAFVMGCIAASIVHPIRMKLSGEDRQLAMGPYLAIGVAIAVLWGEMFLRWYLGIMGFAY